MFQILVSLTVDGNTKSKTTSFRGFLVAERSNAMNQFRRVYPKSRERWREIYETGPEEFRPLIRQVLDLMDTPLDDARDEIGKYFGLTTTETRLALHLMEGGSLSGYAADRNVSRNTARNQLQVIFQKTRVTRQSQLVALLRDVQKSLDD